MEEKKFLDANGLRVLWDKILEEDYTNNSILTAVINAIDEAKADREEVPPLPLQGTTEDITPEDIGMALLEGRNIVLSHNEPNFGVSTFTNFAYNSQLDIITCSTTIIVDNYPVNVQLSGDKDGWHFQILPFIIDPTLSQEGAAADAKAVGDAIAALGQKSQIQIITWEEND